MLMARVALWAVLMMGLLTACDQAGPEATPGSPESAVQESPASILFWAEGAKVATGPWPEVAYRAELDRPVNALAVLNDQLLAATEDGILRQLIPVQVADGGRLAPTRRVQLGCRIEAMSGRDRQLWVLYRACDAGSLHVAQLRLPELSVTAQRELAPDHAGPVSLALGDEHLFVLHSDPFELSRLRLGDLATEGRIELRRDGGARFGFGELLLVGDRLWVVDRYADRLIQIRPDRPGIDVSRSFASMEMPGAVTRCLRQGEQVYCLAGAVLYGLDPQQMQAKRLHTATARLESLLVDGHRLLFGNNDGTLALDPQNGRISALAEHALPSHAVRIR